MYIYQIVLFDCNLNFYQQTSEVALKANRVLVHVESLNH